MLRLGMIGLSEGNGHPWSWSAIFNGYDPAKMARCPFPVIPRYLSEQNFPEDQIADAKVTHIWTQDQRESQKIADATFIPNVVPEAKDLIGEVDGVLFARDDWENHLEMTTPFLEAGLPIFIDKPITILPDQLQEFFKREKKSGQIFTCSAMRYSPDFELAEPDRQNLGEILYADAVFSGSWEKYSVHLIEPVLKLTGLRTRPRQVQTTRYDEGKIVTFSWETGQTITFHVLGYRTQCPLEIRLYGTEGYRNILSTDRFLAFRASLQSFVDIILKRRPPQNREFLKLVVDIIHMGMQ